MEKVQKNSMYGEMKGTFADRSNVLGEPQSAPIDPWKSYRAVGRVLEGVGVKEEKILTRKELEDMLASGKTFEEISRERWPQAFNQTMPARSALSVAIDPKRAAMREAALPRLGD